MNKKILLQSFISSILTAGYIALVALFINNAQNIFGKTTNNLLGPIAFLMLFVFSAAVTGFLIVGRPILWFVAGKKKEAFWFFGANLTWLFIFMVKAMIILAVIR